MPTPEANLGLEEALLDRTAATGVPVLRFWESPAYFVVLGRSSKLSEVRTEQCRKEGVPIHRRASGGGVVLAGPGCLMYSVVLPQEILGRSRGIDSAHEYVLGRIVHALQPLVPSLSRAGTSDLALSANGTQHKVSGNALRMRAGRFLYHGTLLYNFDLSRISRWLGDPLRTPAYRADRAHEGFVANLPLAGDDLRWALASEWSADNPLVDPPLREAEALAATKYSDENWNLAGRLSKPTTDPLDPERHSPS